MRLRDISKWQVGKLLSLPLLYLVLGTLLLSTFCVTLYRDRQEMKAYWDNAFVDSPKDAALVAELSRDAVRVTCGTYIDKIDAISVKDSRFCAELLIWFRWTGDAALDPFHHFRIYRGAINSQILVKESHTGAEHYQLARVNVTISKRFSTKRFPLDSQVLKIYIEATRPVQQMVFVADMKDSGLNKDLNISGYRYSRHNLAAVSYEYANAQGDPAMDGQTLVQSELVTALEIKRDGYGMYIKCFVALVGTLTWVIITLFICTFHHIDPLGMIPASLFGTVSNIIVGANLLPDAFDMGLLEYVNFWGIFTILAATVSVISINRLRAKRDDDAFAHLFGTVLFYITLVFAIVGNLLLPMIAHS